MPLSCEEYHVVRKNNTIVRMIPLTLFPSLQRRAALMPKLYGDLFSAYFPLLASEVSRAGTESPPPSAATLPMPSTSSVPINMSS